MSPTRRPLRLTLSVYVGPIPLRVEPIFPLPIAASFAASRSLCVGSIRWAFFAISILCFTGTPVFAIFSHSHRNVIGSSTTPLPTMLMASSLKIPDGTDLSTKLCPSKCREWPAFGPPWNLATTGYLSARTSTILPFPSSPHWRPRTTSVFISE